MSILTAFGLATAAGLNAYLPLLVVALLARFTDLLTLEPPWDTLESWWVIGVLVVLLVIEVLVDKVPAVDSINDAIQTFVRPAAGAILFAASAGIFSDASPVLSLVCGLLIAGGVHAAKATARPVVTGTTAGTLNPVVSVLEDIVSLVVAILSIVVPVLALLVLVVFIILFIRWLRRRRERLSAAEW
jgi:uncharacterized protein YggT (Ycf19 family)